MRLELALIVGILFFCSWCAYIVARMGSSVAPAASQTGGGSGGGDYNTATASSPVAMQLNQTTAASWPPELEGAPADLAAQQLFRHHLAAAQQLAQQHPRAAYAAAAASRWPPTQTQAAYAETGAQSWPGQVYAAAPAWQAAPNGPDETSGSGGGGEESGNEIGDANETAAPAEAEPDEAETSELEPPESSEGEQPEGESRLDEVARRSSFSESTDEERERGPDGRLVLERRRHLRNGRPVQRPGEQSQEGDDEEGAGEEEEERGGGEEKDSADGKGDGEESKGKNNDDAEDEDGDKNAELRRERDFNRLVAEIDREKRAQRKQARASARTAGTAMQSQTLSKRIGELANVPTPLGKRLAKQTGANERPLDKGHRRAGNAVQESTSGSKENKKTSLSNGDEPAAENENENESAAWRQRPQRRRRRRQRLRASAAKPREQHEHRIQETLEQQQWDDNSKLAPEPSDGDGRTATANSAAGAAEDAAGSEASEGARNHKIDEEERQLESLANNLMHADDPQEEEELETSTKQSLDRRRRQVGVSRSNELAKFEGNKEKEEEEDDRTIGASKRDQKSIEAKTLLENAKGLDNKANGSLEHSAGQLKMETHLERFDDGQNQLQREEDLKVEVLTNPPETLGLLPAINPQLGGSNALGTGGSLVLGLPVPAVPVGGRAAFPAPQQVASGSHKKAHKVKKKTKKKTKKGLKKSEASSSKYKAAKAYEQKRRSKKKKGQVLKKKKKSEKKYLAGDKHFKGSTRGKKLAGGHGHKGANAAQKYYKDKGYKKRGFKKSYHKLETGDHKTYFDEFRDKDHDNKWKKFDDKHKYSQAKRWSGSDMKRAKHHKLAEARGKASKSGHWNEKSKSMRMKNKHKLNKSHKHEYGEKKKKKKKKVKEYKGGH